MTLDEFRSLTDAWGADLDRWPQHLREAAAICALSPQAQKILAEARQLDRLILGARPKVSQERIGRAIFEVAAIVSRASALPRGRVAFGNLFGVPWWSLAAASLVCAAILGVCLGVAMPLAALRSPPSGAALTMILDEGAFDPGWVLR